MNVTRLGLVVAVVAMPLAAFAEGCADYPFASGIVIEPVSDGVKIIATASVGVTFDDVDAVNDARDEATMEAKAKIARWLSETLSSDDALNKAVNETTSMQGDQKTATRTATISRLKQLRSSASALLRGVVPLGDCLTPGREMRVSVGLKPETIAAATRAAGAINPGPQSQPPNTSGAAPAVAPSNQQPLNRPSGFNNSDQLKRF